MKKISYLPLLFLTVLAASCGDRTGKKQDITIKADHPKELFATMQLKDTIKMGEPVEMTFTVYNHTDSVMKFLKWQTPFEPLLSKYLDIKDEQGEEALYKGAMAKRMMPPPAADSLSLKANDSLSVKSDLLKGYDIVKPGKYTVTYNSEGVSGVKVYKSVTFVYR